MTLVPHLDGKKWHSKPLVCRIEGCSNPANTAGAARGLCRAHYRRWQNHGSELAPVKKAYSYKGLLCEKEGCEKPARTLKLCHRHYVELRRKTDDGKIQEKAEKAKRRVSLWKQHQKESFAGRVMPEKCEVCKESSESGHRLNFDHCHSSHLFRGWICGRCNRVLGVAKDSPQLLRKLADYLDAFELKRNGKMGNREEILALFDGRGKSGWERKSGKAYK